MTSLQFQCPFCNGPFQIDPAYAGQMVGCPTCGRAVSLPSASASEVAPPVFDVGPPPAEPPQSPPWQPSSPASASAPVSLQCPLCGGGFQITPDMFGQQVLCPHCQSAVSTPPASEPVRPPPGEFPTVNKKEIANKKEQSTGPKKPEDRSSGLAKQSVQPGKSDALPAPPDEKSPGRAKAPSVAAQSTPTQQRRQSTRIPAAGAPAKKSLLKAFATPAEAEAWLPPRVDPSLPWEPQDEQSLIGAGEQLAVDAVAVHEPVKTLIQGGERIELRRLTPAEKAQRRARRNLIMAVAGVLLLIAVLWLLNQL